jgi:hypothetical protein
LNSSPSYFSKLFDFPYHSYQNYWKIKTASKEKTWATIESKLGLLAKKAEANIPSVYAFILNLLNREKIKQRINKTALEKYSVNFKLPTLNILKD